MKAAELRRRLAIKFGKTGDAVATPEHVVLFEVLIDGRALYDGGPAIRQRIDAVAVGMWRRTDHLVHGFEIKCSRADLLAELRDLSKSAAAVAMCDTYSLVLSDPDLLRPDDPLPDGWGVLAVRGHGLGWVRRPEVREGRRDGRHVAGLLQAAARTHGACRGLARVGYVPLSRYDEVKAERDRYHVEAWTLRAENERLRALVPATLSE